MCCIALSCAPHAWNGGLRCQNLVQCNTFLTGAGPKRCINGLAGANLIACGDHCLFNSERLDSKLIRPHPVTARGQDAMVTSYYLRIRALRHVLQA
jgi:hypothetical protein